MKLFPTKMAHALLPHDRQRPNFLNTGPDEAKSLPENIDFLRHCYVELGVRNMG